jgi:hypothetical protein
VVLGGVLGGVAGSVSWGVAWKPSPTALEDRIATTWIAGVADGRSTAMLSERPLDRRDVPAPALARALVRKDTSVGKLYRAARDRLPGWIRRRFPRPLDERFRGAAASIGLLDHRDAGDALPVLAAALTDPRCANHGLALQAVTRLGDALPDALLMHALKDLTSNDPSAQLRALGSLARVWPARPELTRRIDELRGDIRDRSPAPAGTGVIERAEDRRR